MTTGEIFGPFKLIRPIGHGGMGSVHLAEDASGRQMALKLVPEHLSKNEMFRNYSAWWMHHGDERRAADSGKSGFQDIPFLFACG